MASSKILRKPHWLKQEDWTALIERQPDRIPHCAETGETDDLTIDHIVPRYDGGTDDISNLQFLKRSLNSRKGIKPDKYWNQSFCFDQVPMLSACRAAQRGLYNETRAYADWFSQSPTEISRLLYTFAMVVGSGKTLATLMAACAYNSIIRGRWGAARRADRVLVLCKERAIRDQFADDIAKDPTRYGIFPTNPRVGKVTRGDQFEDEAWLSSHDVIVSCIQQLWDRGVGNLNRLLHYFPVIYIDEPHFAIDQVLAIVENATTSICFGGTGSPIDGMGKLLDRMIRLYCFSYQDADENDRSVKYLDGTNWYDQHIHVAELDEAQLLDAGRIRTSSNTGAPGYDKNFEPAKSVVWQTIRHMERCDKLDKLDPKFVNKAPHRQQYECEIANFYPVHAMICCDSVRFADHLMRVTNNMFAKDQKRFPRDQGWCAAVVHCEGEEPDGSPRPDKPLLPGHSWLRAMKQGRLDADCCRLLFVVGMGREGVNNTYCGLVGVTSDHASIIEVVQRMLGRQVRAIVTQQNGIWYVPPAELDIVTIITHEVFANMLPAVRDGIDFVVNMKAKLQGLLTIEDLEQGEEPIVRKPPDTLSPLPFKDKIDIAGMIGGDPNIDDDDIVVKISGGNPGMERPIRDFIKNVRTTPTKVAQGLRINRGYQLRALSTVLWEAIIQNPDDRQLTNFLRDQYPHLVDSPINEHTRPLMEEMFKKHAAEVAAATPPLLNIDGGTRTIDEVRKNIGGAILLNLGVHYVKSRGADEDLWSCVAVAVKTVLGVPRNESARNGSQWDIPNCLIMLERAEIHRMIQCYVISRLIEKGHCPSLAHLH